MRRATFAICVLNLVFLVWLGSELLTGGGGGPEMRGVDEFVFFIVAGLFGITTFPAALLALERKMPRLALGLALTMPVLIGGIVCLFALSSLG